MLCELDIISGNMLQMKYDEIVPQAIARIR